MAYINYQRGTPDNFTMIPNIIGDIHLSMIAIRLYLQLASVAGNRIDGCWQSRDTLAKECDMSAGAISKAKKELIDAGLITITKKKSYHGGLDYDSITVNNIWERNHDFYENERLSQSDQNTTSFNDKETRPLEINKPLSNKNNSTNLSIIGENNVSTSQIDLTRTPDDLVRTPSDTNNTYINKIQFNNINAQKNISTEQPFTLEDKESSDILPLMDKETKEDIMINPYEKIDYAQQDELTPGVYTNGDESRELSQNDIDNHRAYLTKCNSQSVTYRAVFTGDELRGNEIYTECMDIDRKNKAENIKVMANAWGMADVKNPNSATAQAMVRGLQTHSGDKVDYSKFPEQVQPLLRMFVEKTGIVPMKKELRQWQVAVQDWIEIGLTVQDVERAIARMRSGKNKISITSPMSISKIARSIKSGI